MRPKRKDHRLQYRFWLDVFREDEYKLAEYVEDLKKNRLFARTIRDGLGLIQDLRSGNMKVLLRQFPWVRDQLEAEIRAELAEETSNVQPTLQAHFERIEQLLTVQQKALPPLPTHQLPPPKDGFLKPVSDDFEIELNAAKRDENNNSTWNLLISSSISIVGHCNDLPPEVIQYGLKTGRIPKDKLSPHKLKSNEQAQSSKAPKGPKAMNVPEIAPPVIEDLPDDLLSL